MHQIRADSNPLDTRISWLYDHVKRTGRIDQSPIYLIRQSAFSAHDDMVSILDPVSVGLTFNPTRSTWQS
jgi:hypothetical protein